MSFKISEYVVKPITIDSSASVSEICSKMLKSKVNSFLVTDGKNTGGMISDRQIYRINYPPASTKASTLEVNYPVVDEKFGLEELLSLFTDSSNRMVMVKSGNKFLGVIDEKAVIKILLKEENLKGKKISSLVLDSNTTIQANQSIQFAISKLKTLNITHLLVLSSDLSEQGVVSTWDIATKVIPKTHEEFDSLRGGTFKQEVSVLQEQVESIASSSIISLSFNDSIFNCLKTMQSKSVNSVAIFDNGQFVGFVSLRDCISAVLSTTSQRVFVFGLKNHMRPLSASIESYASVLFEKWSKKNEVTDVYLHIKSFDEGNKHRFLVHARGIYKGKVYSVSSPERPDHFQNWDVFQSVKESMDELGRVLSDQVHSTTRKIDRKRDLKYRED